MSNYESQNYLQDCCVLSSGLRKPQRSRLFLLGKEKQKKKKRMEKVSGFHCLQLSGICLCFLEKSIHKKVSEAKSLSHVRLFATPWTVAYKASPSMGFSK